MSWSPSIVFDDYAEIHPLAVPISFDYGLELVGYQASRRGGIVYMKLAEERIYLSGDAVTVLGGTLTA